MKKMGRKTEKQRQKRMRKTQGDCEVGQRRTERKFCEIERQRK